MRTHAVAKSPSTNARATGVPVKGLQTAADARIRRILRAPDQGGLSLGRRQDACEGEAEKAARAVNGQAQPERGIQPAIHRSQATAEGRIPEELASRIARMQRSGQPFPEGLRGRFEPAFGRDFGAVRIHTGPEAAETAHDLAARAYTIGSHVAFAPGEFRPETPAGRALIAHELTHVIQQGAHPATNLIQRQPLPGGSYLEQAAAPATARSAEFLEHPDQVHHGFDPVSTPQTLVVPKGAKRKLRVKVKPEGAQIAYQSLDPAQATVQPTADGIEVTGVSTGGAGAGVEATADGQVLTHLQVVVLPFQEVSVGYHYLSDPPRRKSFLKLPEFKTSRSPGDETQLTEMLNRAWFRQANIRFTIHSIQSDTLATRMGNEFKGKDAQLTALLSPFASGAQMEVFCVWTLKSTNPDSDPNGRYIKKTNFTILQDHDNADGYDLAHEAGHFLGWTIHTKGGLMDEASGASDRPRIYWDWAVRANRAAGKV